MTKQPHQCGVELHEAALVILARKGKEHGYTAGLYLKALAQAEEEGTDNGVPRSGPDVDGLLHNAIGIETERLLAAENRSEDPDRYIEIFSTLARRHALRGYLNPTEQEQDNGS